MSRYSNFCSIRSILKAITAACAIGSIAACSNGSSGPFHGPGGFIHPQIGPSNYSPIYQYNPHIADDHIDNDPSANFRSLAPFELALAKAERLDNQLYNAMWWNDTYGFITGAGMFGAGIATLAFGVFDASRALLLGGGLTTAGFAGVRQFYPFSDRNALYSKGRTALQCAVEATQTAVNLSETIVGGGSQTANVIGPYSLDEILVNAKYAAFELQSAENPYPGRGNVETEVARQLWTQSTIANANALLEAVETGRSVQAQIQPALQASTLNAIVLRIHTLVDAQADALRPNPDAALNVARDQFQATLTGIKDVALKSRDTARQVDNQKPKPSTDGKGKSKADVSNTDDSAKKLTDEAKIAMKNAEEADKNAAAAAVNAAEAAKKAEAAADAKVSDAAKLEIGKTKLAILEDAAAKAAEAKALNSKAIDAKAAADAKSKEPVANASFWANVLAGRMDYIAQKLQNVDSCTATFSQTSS